MDLFLVLHHVFKYFVTTLVPFMKKSGAYLWLLRYFYEWFSYRPLSLHWVSTYTNLYINCIDYCTEFFTMRPLVYSSKSLINIGKSVNNNSSRVNSYLWSKMCDLKIARKTRRGCRGSGSQRGLLKKLDNIETVKTITSDIDRPKTRTGRPNLVNIPFVTQSNSSKLKCNFAMWNAQSKNNKTTLICDNIKNGWRWRLCDLKERFWGYSTQHPWI